MILNLTGVSKTYRGTHNNSVRALREVNLSVGAGEAVGLVGESGSGKSSLLKCLMRLSQPDAGLIEYDGMDVTRARSADLRRFRREVQMVFQDPYVSLNGRMTVEALVGEGLVVHRMTRTKSERRDRVAATLELVGLSPNDMARFPSSFSGGQRQRIAIARALAVQPRVLVCDEPVASLDVSVQAQVINLIMDMQKRLGLSVLFVAHDLAVVHHLCSRIAVLHKGEIVDYGTREEIFGAPRSNHTRALLDAVPIPDPMVERAKRRARLAGRSVDPVTA